MSNNYLTIVSCNFSNLANLTRMLWQCSVEGAGSITIGGRCFKLSRGVRKTSSLESSTSCSFGMSVLFSVS